MEVRKHCSLGGRAYALMHVIGEQEEGKLVLIWRPTLASISSCIKKSGHFLAHTKDQPPTLCWNPLSIASLAAAPSRNYTVEEWLPSVWKRTLSGIYVVPKVRAKGQIFVVVVQEKDVVRLVFAATRLPRHGHGRSQCCHARLAAFKSKA